MDASGRNWLPRGVSPRAVALDYLEELTRRLHALALERDQAVADAVAAGADWVQIGQAAGLTRQGARQRWNRRLPDPRLVAHDDCLPPDPVDAPVDLTPSGPSPLAEIPDPMLSALLFTWQVFHEQPPEEE
ncbi:conserved hypothetical protein [Frankia canadensis]|uniref:Uncharacterized protein n=1 Tax=Frankia canadensis TaxID=1836972 RepID=A0A2I2KW05_9ACTN|nr:hypothetical protein [Frankia canadensis]SNQ49863.1 conserved hypothetical protein [Frankia canadensis]SOU57153.1 conserved hypothetical protein [Frankia canadensis]